jgi:dipeptidyl aminopeptidase/acylaminoacyl peptidase
LIRMGLADPGRLGALGLSHGGFIVNWLISTTDLFAAAVVENGVANQISVWGNSDIGPPYCQASGLGDVVTDEGVRRLWESSPLRHVQDIHTPLLILQGDADLRCPKSDNEQLFVALRWLRRDVQYVLYPGGNHLFQGTGAPAQRFDRHRRVLEWFETYIPPDGE